jgi:hypothetical protein
VQAATLKQPPHLVNLSVMANSSHAGMNTGFEASDGAGYDAATFDTFLKVFTAHSALVIAGLNLWII